MVYIHICTISAIYYVYVRVASRNRTLAHVRRFEKWPMKLARPKIVFTGLPEGYQISFWAEDFGIFNISSIASKKDELKCPLLPILAGSLVCISLTTMSSTESSFCSSPDSMDLSGCFCWNSRSTMILLAL